MTPTPTQSIGRGSFWTLFARPSGWAFLAFTCLTMSGALFIQSRQMKAFRHQPWSDRLDMPKPEYVKALSLGYDAWIADFLYIRVIQAYGGSFQKKDQVQAAYNYFNVLSTLDPQFMEAYTFGNLVVGDESGDAKLALEYMKFGQRHNYHKSLPWIEAAFTKIWTMSQLDNEARFYVRMAAKSPDVPDYIYRWENYIQEESGQYYAAIAKWIDVYAKGRIDKQDYMVAMAESKFFAIVDRWHREILQKAADKYLEDKKVAAKDLEQLVAEGYLPEVETLDPERIVATLKDFAARGIDIVSREEEILKSALVKRQGIPPHYETTGFVGKKWVMICDMNGQQKSIDSDFTRLVETQTALRTITDVINQFQSENNRYPENLEEIAKLAGTLPVDPFCEGWEYDKEKHIVVTKGDRAIEPRHQ